MRRHRRHSTAFKRQIVEEYLAGAALNALSKEHDICRHLIEKYEAGEFDAEKEAADTLHDYQAMIAALERLAGRQAPRDRVPKGGSVEHGGNSFGSIAHRQPIVVMWRIAFTTSRRFAARGRPSGFGGGMNGAISAHSQPVRSLA